MAKVALSMSLKRNNGTTLVASITSGDKATFSEAKQALADNLQARVDAAGADLSDLQDAQNSFNS